MKQSWISILISCLSLTIISCSIQKRYTQTELYFGLSLKNGQIINDSNWNVFAKDYIGKIFFNGFTILSSEGRWVDIQDMKMYTEPSRVVISVNRMNRQLSTNIDSLIGRYKKLFDQESVLRIDKKAKASF